MNATIIKSVMSLAKEAKLATSFFNAKEAIHICNIILRWDTCNHTHPYRVTTPLQKR
jgi:hypothetical protein